MPTSKQESPSDSAKRRRLSEAFVQVADSDLSAANKLADTHPREAAFHAQQAAEKYLKGVLTADAIDFGGTTNKHSLVELVDRLSTSHHLYDDFDKVVALERYATSFRYPTPSGNIKSVEDMSDIMSKLDILRELSADVTDHIKHSFAPTGPTKRR